MKEEYKEMKTPKGTMLPLLMIERKRKNKKTNQYETLPPRPYLQVAHRLVWFREEHPNGCIRTKIIHSDNVYSLIEAVILDKDQNILAMAHKREDAQDWNDHIEKAETGAIGRALALCGYGTQFAPEIEEQDRLVDSPVEVKVSKEELDALIPPGTNPWDPNEPMPNFDELPPMTGQKEDKKKFNQFYDGKYKGLTFEEFSRDVPRASGYAHFLQDILNNKKPLTEEKKDFLDFAKRKGLLNIKVSGSKI